MKFLSPPNRHALWVSFHPSTSLVSSASRLNRTELPSVPAQSAIAGLTSDPSASYCNLDFMHALIIFGISVAVLIVSIIARLTFRHRPRLPHRRNCERIDKADDTLDPISSSPLPFAPNITSFKKKKGREVNTVENNYSKLSFPSSSLRTLSPLLKFLTRLLTRGRR